MTQHIAIYYYLQLATKQTFKCVARSPHPALTSSGQVLGYVFFVSKCHGDIYIQTYTIETSRFNYKLSKGLYIVSNALLECRQTAT